jgi:hypothetical protein
MRGAGRPACGARARLEPQLLAGRAPSLLRRAYRCSCRTTRCTRPGLNGRPRLTGESPQLPDVIRGSTPMSPTGTTSVVCVAWMAGARSLHPPIERMQGPGAPVAPASRTFRCSSCNPPRRRATFPFMQAPRDRSPNATASNSVDPAPITLHAAPRAFSERWIVGPGRQLPECHAS